MEVYVGLHSMNQQLYSHENLCCQTHGAAYLRVQPICGYLQYLRAIIYVIYIMTVISTFCWRQMVSTPWPIQEGSIQSSLVKLKLSPNRLLRKEILQDSNSSVKLFECVIFSC